MPMRRIHMIVEYDGTNYAGWQRQANALAVQQVIEEALSKLTRERIVIHGASRTDAGSTRWASPATSTPNPASPAISSATR